MTKTPTPTEKSKNQRDNTKKIHKNFDYTTIADRLRTIIWKNDSHPTDGSSNPSSGSGEEVENV